MFRNSILLNFLPLGFSSVNPTITNVIQPADLIFFFLPVPRRSTRLVAVTITPEECVPTFRRSYGQDGAVFSMGTPSFFFPKAFFPCSLNAVFGSCETLPNGLSKNLTLVHFPQPDLTARDFCSTLFPTVGPQGSFFSRLPLCR